MKIELRFQDHDDEDNDIIFHVKSHTSLFLLLQKLDKSTSTVNSSYFGHTAQSALKDHFGEAYRYLDYVLVNFGVMKAGKTFAKVFLVLIDKEKDEPESEVGDEIDLVCYEKIEDVLESENESEFEQQLLSLGNEIEN